VLAVINPFVSVKAIRQAANDPMRELKGTFRPVLVNSTGPIVPPMSTPPNRPAAVIRLL
jgi:hypothetical protein